MKLNTISEAIEDLKNNKIIIVVDDENRENEGDFVFPAEIITPEVVNFMATNGRGLICVPLTSKRCERLGLNPMVSNNTELMDTAFTISVDLKGNGVTSGISAIDRSKTIQALVDNKTNPENLLRPGHIFPLSAKDGGVLRRTGHTEAAVDIARLSGFKPAGVICEIMNEDGTMARRDDLIKFGQENEIKVGTIADLIDYRLSMDATVESVLDKDVVNEFGEFKLNVWRDKIHDEYHFSLSKGDIKSVDSPLVRVQTQSILQDTLGIDELGKNWSIRDSLKRISDEGIGLFVLINYKDAKSYWLNKLEEKEIEPKANRRVIGVGSQILRALDLKKITVLGTPTKYNAVSGFDIEITGFVNE